MSTYKKKSDFFETQEGAEFVQLLMGMVNDNTYNTESTYSPDSEMYPDNLIPFVDKHIDYMRKHPAINAQHYLSNLRLMTRQRANR